MIFVPFIRDEGAPDSEGVTFSLTTSEGEILFAFSNEGELAAFARLASPFVPAGKELFGVAFPFDAERLASYLSLEHARVVRDDDPFYARSVISLAGYTNDLA